MAQDGAENRTAAKAVSVAVFKPQLVVPAMKADEAVQFYKAAFGAVELKRMNHPKRKAEQELPLILCAELKFGSSSLLVCDQNEDCAAEEGAIGGRIVFRMETEDVEGTVAKAVKAGAALEGEIMEEGACGGGLLGKVKDPFGVVWDIVSAGKKCAEAEA